jgi:hypothetical protein
MTLTPNMGRHVLHCLEKDNIRPEHPQHPEPLPLLYPELGLPAWETLFT